MKFTEPGEKIKQIRKKLNIRQEELEGLGVSRNFLSMVENGKRKLPNNLLKPLVELFNKKALDLGIELNIDETFIMKTASEDANNYCSNKLKESLSLEDLNELIKISENYNLHYILSKTHELKANILYDSKNYEEAFMNYYEALEGYTKLNLEKEQAFIYNKLGKCNIEMLHYMEALTFFNKCYEYSKIHFDKELMKNSLFNIALANKKLEKYNVALTCLNEYLSLVQDQEVFEDYADGIILKAACHIELKEYQRAIELSINLIDKFEDQTSPLLGCLYNNLGMIYLNVNDLKNSLYYFNKSALIRELNNDNKLCRTILNKSKVYLKAGMLENALTLVKEAINLTEMYNDLEFQIRGYRLLEEIYTEMNKIEELQFVYDKMLNILANSDYKSDLLKVYIKIALLNIENGNIEKALNYLNTAKVIG